MVHYIQCQLRSWLGYPVPSNYVQHQTNISNKVGGYLLLEYIDEKQGQMLSTTWDAGRANPKLRTNLYRGLSRVMISLAQHSFPRIGSLVIDDQGFVRLENRPLTLDIHTSENEEIPIPIPRDRTYYTSDAYVNDLLLCHDNRLRHQPNAVKSISDCATQMSALSLMRTLRSEFFDQTYNRGPFVVCLTDMHQSNILVDDDWNVKYILDLEWAAVLPFTFMQPPSWLTNEPVDMITLESYGEQRKEFMAAFEQEEGSLPQRGCILYSSAMNRSWEISTFWYILALQHPTALHAIFYNRIQAGFNKEHGDDEEFYLKTYPYWTRCANDFIMMKVKHKEDYDAELLKAFTDSTPKQRDITLS